MTEALLDLLAMSGTHARPVTLDGVAIADRRIGAVVDRREWPAVDAVRTAGTADALVGECRVIRGLAHGMADANGPRPERRALRARSLDLAARATTAVVVARSGAAMRRGHAAERRVREAMFLLMRAQTADTRAASLELAADRARSGSDVA